MCHSEPQAERGDSWFGIPINVELSLKHKQRSMCVCRSRNGQTKEQHTVCRHETCLHAGLTRFEGVIDWAGDSSLPCEQGAAEAHVVSRVPDAELGQQQLPGWLLHQESVSPTLSFSRPRRQWQPLAGYLCSCMLSLRVFRRSGPKNEQKAATLSLGGRVAV